MRRIVLTLATIFSVFCLVACGGETKDDVTTGSNKETVVGNGVSEPTAKPVVTAEATDEPTPTEEPVVEATPEPTPEPTEEPVVYEGIDMESDLPGEDWIETFIGVIEDPKVVIYNDETGRKEIVEEGTKVPFNPDKDTFAVYLPEGYDLDSKVAGLNMDSVMHKEFGYVIFLNPEKTREHKFEMITVYVVKKNNDEIVEINFTLKSE